MPPPQIPSRATALLTFTTAFFYGTNIVWYARDQESQRREKLLLQQIKEHEAKEQHRKQRHMMKKEREAAKLGERAGLGGVKVINDKLVFPAKGQKVKGKDEGNERSEGKGGKGGNGEYEKKEETGWWHGPWLR